MIACNESIQLKVVVQCDHGHYVYIARVALCIADEKLTVHTLYSTEHGKSAIVFVEEPGKIL